MLGGVALGQGYPLPGPATQPPVVCVHCGNLPTWPYDSPIVAHRGRFLDSTRGREVQSPIRTFRAERVAIVPERDRIYMKFGSALVSYRLSTFFARDLDGRMRVMDGRENGEEYLQYVDWVYPEAQEEWVTSFQDGQERMGAGFDWDDRGYVYIPAKIFGWGIVRDVDARFQFIKQMGGPLGGAGSDVTPSGTISFRHAGKYYLYVYDVAATRGSLFDVTDPGDPRYVKPLAHAIRDFAKATLGSTDVVAYTDANTGQIRIFGASSFIAGAPPEAVIEPFPGIAFTAIASDGTRFFAGEGAATSPGNVAIVTAGTGTVASYAAERYAVPGDRFLPSSIAYSTGVVSVVGYGGGGNTLHMFRLAGSAPQYVDFHDFFKKYYSGTLENGVQYAAPGFCSSVHAGVAYRDGGKDYLIYATNGLGDVYEIQRDGISLVRDAASPAGTRNPYSEGAAGPFYGDEFRFKTASTQDPVPILVDYGNPEASTGNTSTAIIGEPLSYRYSGLASAASIRQTRTVRISTADDPSRQASVSVTMEVPAARVRAMRRDGSRDLLFTRSDEAADVPLLVGDSFVDASDGSVEGHLARWTLDGAPGVTQLPNVPFAAGACGSHVLSFTAVYGARRNLVPLTTPDYTLEIANARYSVRPFAARIAIESANESGARFRADVRVGANALAGGSSAAASFAWDLLDAAGGTIRSSRTTATLGAPPEFSVSTAELATAKSVRLTVTLTDAAAIIAPGCGGMASSSDSAQLIVPDPVLAVTGCTTLGGSCSINATSASGKSQSGWTYSWVLNDVPKGTSAAPTYIPAAADIAAAGTYRVKVRARNEGGMSGESQAVTFTLAAPACGAIPDDAISFTWSGVDGCAAGACTAGSVIRFYPRATRYAFQGCDSFLWSFGDGSTSTEKYPQHKFPANGTYSVTLLAINDLTPGGRSVTHAVTLGSSSPSIDFAAPSGCSKMQGSPPCRAGEVVTLELKNLGSFQDGTFDWDFGDGTALSGAKVTTVQHQFPPTAPEYTVTVTIRNAGGTAKVSETVRITGEAAEPKATEFTYLLPVVSHVDGANGSRWRTDLEIYNGNSASGPIELELELTSAKIRKTLTLNVATLIYEDLMSFFTSADAAGPVILRGSAPRDLQIWTRTYSIDASGSGTYGHLIPAIRIDGHPSLAAGSSSLYLTNLNHTVKYRTNVYLLNITGSNLPVTITAYEGESGSVVGQLSKEVAPFELTPLSAGEIPGAPTTGPFSAAVQASSGGLIAYESVVDNGSNDPIYVPAIATSDLDDPDARTQVVPSVGHFQSWRSDLTVFNPDDQEIRFDLAFHDGDGALRAEAKGLTLPPKALLQLDDFVRSPSMTPPISGDVIGTLRMTVTSSLTDRFPVIAQRNYSDSGDRRRFGQGILGFATAAANVAVARPAILPAVRSDSRYYSNVGIANVGSTDANVTLKLLDQKNGEVIGTHNLVVRPNESRILQDIVRFLHPTEDRASIRVETTGGSIWAFASIIDRVTRDPEYVPAIPLD